MHKRRTTAAVLFAPVLFGSVAVVRPAFAAAVHVRDEEPEVIGGKIVALKIESEGNLPVPTDGFRCTLQFSVAAATEAQSRTALKEERDRITDLLKTAGIKDPYVDPVVGTGQGETLYSKIAFEEANRATVVRVIEQLRRAHISGSMAVTPLVSEAEKYHAATVKKAIEGMQARLRVFSEASKPQTLRLLKINEGEFNAGGVGWYTFGLDKSNPIVLPSTTDATVKVTMRYALTDTATAARKPVQAATAKPKSTAVPAKPAMPRTPRKG